MKISKKLTSQKEALHWLVKKFPKPLRHSTYRHLVRIKTTPPAGVHFKLATTPDEFTQAFSILHDAYVEAGLMKPDPSGLRITPYHLLPTTSTLIAKNGDTVIGTVSLIRQGAFGLPSEAGFDLSPLKSTGRQIAEISAVAICPEWRGRTFLPLTKFGYEYCTRFFGIDTFVCTSDAASGLSEFYEGAILFKKISEHPCSTYSFSNHVPVVGLFLHLDEAYENWARHYAHRPKNSDLFSYFTRLKWNCFEFPKREFFSCIDPVLTPELFDHLFKIKPNLIKTISPFQLACLRRIYDCPEFKTVFDKQANLRSLPSDARQKGDFRFPTAIPGVICLEGETIEIKALDVSNQGFTARLKNGLPPALPEKCQAILRINERFSAELEAEPVWAQSSGMVGFKIHSSDQNWRMLLNYLHNQILARHGTEEKIGEFLQKAA